MKTKKNQMFLAVLLIALAAIMIPQGASATTVPCTQVSNQASLEYQVGLVTQPTITSTLGAGNQFYVGAKVNVSVANQTGANVTATPGSTPAVIEFRVQNDGNAIQDYALTVVSDTTNTPSPYGGGNDSFDGTTVVAYVENGTTVGFQAAEDTATSIDNLGRDGGQKTVYIVYTPSDLSQPNNAIAVYYLKATTQWANGAAIGAEGPQSLTTAMAGAACGGGTTVDVVFGDGDGPGTTEANRDAMHADDGAYIVSNAAIGITKSKTTVWDPINFNSSPKTIPGAIVEYSVVVANTGGAAATLTSIIDSLDTTNLSLVSTFYDGALGTAAPTSTTGEAFVVTCSAGCGARACEAGAGTSFTAAADADGIDFATPTITATMSGVLPAESTCSAGSLGASGDTVTIKFQVTIN